MKKRRTAAAAVIISLLMLAGCASQNGEAASAGSSAGEGTASQPEELRTMLTWNDLTLCAKTQDAASCGAWRLEARRGDAAGGSSGASLFIDLRKTDAEGTLQITGAVYLGEDASALLDSEETDGAQSAGETLKATVKGIVEEAGGGMTEEQAGELTITYGFTEEEKEDANLTYLYAWAEPEGGFIFVNVEAAETGNRQTDLVKDKLKEWLLSFTVNGAPGSGAQQLMLPFGEKKLKAGDTDFLKNEGAAVFWETGDGYLKASYNGSTEEAEYICKLRNASVAGEEKAQAARELDGQPVDAPLPWKIKTEGNTLTAAAELEDDILLFEMTVYSDEESADGTAKLLEKAAAWLKTVIIE